MMQPIPSNFTREQARAYDQFCMGKLGIRGLTLMENAARGCADVALRILAEPRGARVLVACGAGQNGGDGYAIARMLADAGCAVRVVALAPPRAGTDAAEMRARAEARGVPIAGFAGDGGAPELVVDALFGTGLDRALEGDALAFVRVINALGVPVLSVDLPSGMDCDTGAGLPECVRATVTATMVAPKRGFVADGARACVGRVEIVPIAPPVPGTECVVEVTPCPTKAHHTEAAPAPARAACAWRSSSV